MLQFALDVTRTRAAACALVGLVACGAQEAAPTILELPGVDPSVKLSKRVELDVPMQSAVQRTALRHEVTGTVRAFETGDPISGVAVWQQTCESVVISAGDGTLRLTLDELAPSRLLCSSTNDRFAYFADGEVDPVERRAQLDIVDSERNVAIEVLDRRNAPITLRVINERTGQPVAGRTVRVEALKHGSRLRMPRPTNDVTDVTGVVRINDMLTGPVEVWVPPHPATMVVHRSETDPPHEVRIDQSPPIEVSLTGAAIGSEDAWRIVVARDGARSFDGLKQIAYGRGPQTRFVPSPAAEELMRAEGDWLLLGVDGTFYGELRGGPQVLEEQRVSFAVEGTVALEILTSAPTSGTVINLRGDDEEPEPSFTIQEWLPHGGRRDYRHEIAPISSDDSWSHASMRLRAGKWLPIDAYRVSLVSPHLKAEPARVHAKSPGVQHVSLRAEDRDDLVLLEVEVRSTASREWSDLPRLTVSEAGINFRTYAVPPPGVLVCGGTALWYHQLPHRPVGTFGFTCEEVQPEDLRFTSAQGSLSERRDPIVDGVLRVYLEFTPEVSAPEPR